MLRRTQVAAGPRGRIVVVDSITQLTDIDRGAIVVSGSHGGVSSGQIALAGAPLKLVFFNDAGVGKDEAGIAALALLQARGTAGGTVSHTSARIGDAQDAWEHGIVSHLNEAARALGLVVGHALQPALLAMIGAR